MSDLSETKRQMSQALKSHFSALEVPGEMSKKFKAKMRLEAKLQSGAELYVACVEIKGGRPPGAYGLYWLFALEGGVIWDAMDGCGLSAHPSMVAPLIFTCTSHNLPSASHFEVAAGSDFDAIAAAICSDIRAQAFPVVEGFDSKPDRALDYLLNRGRGSVRNPFTVCIILMHLAGRCDRLDEIMGVAATAQGFYDFRGATDVRGQIVEPLAKWFKSRA